MNENASSGRLSFHLKTDILLTHNRCLDGSACAAVFAKAGGDAKNVRFIDAGTVDDWLHDGHIVGVDTASAGKPFVRIVITDLGITEATYEQLVADGYEVLLFDHHKTNSWMEKFGEAHFDVSRCGSKLLYDATWSTWDKQRFAEEKFIQYIDMVDRWTDPSNRFAESFSIWHETFGADAFVKRFSQDMFLRPDEYHIINALREQKDEYIRRAVDRAFIRREFGYECICVVVSRYRSQVLNLLLEKSSAEIAVGFLLEDGSVSLRSRKGGPDVSQIARRWNNGGGHANAAGFRAAFNVSWEI